MCETLKRSLSAAGKSHHVFRSDDGTSLLLLPYGGRVLGLYPPGSAASFYWTNPKLDQPATAAAVFPEKGWHNTGGDRTWLTPELDIFFPDYPDTRRHWEPPQLDASEYALIDQGWRVGMKKEMTLRFARPHRDVEIELAKWVSAAANPLRAERDMAACMKDVEYAGYTQQTTWTLGGAAATDPVEVGVWNLVQLPHGGELLVPTYCQTQPRVLFGEIPGDYLIAEDHLVRFRVCLPGEHKIAIRAAATVGRAGYLYPSGKRWSLVVRNFMVNPSGRYVDVPKDAPDDFGYAVHAVNVQSGLGDFCELEYHAPAIGQDRRHIRGVDQSQVWAFRGPEAAVRAIAAKLLGAA